jgi:hypothetical protein
MKESDSMIPFLNILVLRKGLALTMKVHRKPTHSDHYLNFESVIPHMLKEIIQSLHSRASATCQE